MAERARPLKGCCADGRLLDRLCRLDLAAGGEAEGAAGTELGGGGGGGEGDLQDRAAPADHVARTAAGAEAVRGGEHLDLDVGPGAAAHLVRGLAVLLRGFADPQLRTRPRRWRRPGRRACRR